MEGRGIKINVKTAAGEVRLFSLPAGSKIWELKEEIRKSFRVNPNQQCLIFHGYLLKDEMPISEYVKEDNLSIYMMVRGVETSLLLPHLDPANISHRLTVEDIDDLTEDVHFQTFSRCRQHRQGCSPIIEQGLGEPEDEEVYGSDLKEEDIRFVMSHLEISRDRAVIALRENYNDPICAILSSDDELENEQRFDESEDEEVDDSDLDEEDIDIVMSSCEISRAKAIKALRENNNDPINAILSSDYMRPKNDQSFVETDEDEEVDDSDEDIQNTKSVLKYPGLSKHS